MRPATQEVEETIDWTLIKSESKCLSLMALSNIKKIIFDMLRTLFMQLKEMDTLSLLRRIKKCLRFKQLQKARRKRTCQCVTHFVRNDKKLLSFTQCKLQSVTHRTNKPSNTGEHQYRTRKATWRSKIVAICSSLCLVVKPVCRTSISLSIAKKHPMV